MVFGVGMQESLIILAIFFMLFGGKRLPELARGLGKAVKEFKDASKDIKENNIGIKNNQGGER